MDHVWDGFYTGQKRLLRFPAIVEANTDKYHTITYTGTPPLSQMFELYGTEAATDRVKLILKYSNPDLVVVEKAGSEVSRQPLVNGVPQPLAGNVCGENFWQHGANELHFTLLSAPGCSITLKTKQSIALSFRVEMTVNEFYSNNGETQFIDRLAASLGISQSRIRIVGVYEGSVVIESQIAEDPTAAATSEGDSIAEIENISQSIQDMANGGALLGDWNVLDMAITVNTYPGGVSSVTIPPATVS